MKKSVEILREFQFSPAKFIKPPDSEPVNPNHRFSRGQFKPAELVTSEQKAAQRRVNELVLISVLSQCLDSVKVVLRLCEQIGGDIAGFLRF